MIEQPQEYYGFPKFLDELICEDKIMNKIIKRMEPGKYLPNRGGLIMEYVKLRMKKYSLEILFKPKENN